MNGSTSKQRPALAITMGDAAGVGPELCLLLLNHARQHDLPWVPVVIGDYRILQTVAEHLGWAFDAPILTPYQRPDAECRGGVWDMKVLDGETVRPGVVQPCCGHAAGEYIVTAVQALQSGCCDCLLTAPLNKESLHLGGFDYPGHTELLADLTGSRGKEAMLLYSEKIAVSFATLHASLEEACLSLSLEEIVRIGKLTTQTVSQIRRRPVRLGVLALNPHGGEAGLFGQQETNIIQPAIAQLNRLGIQTNGPLVPDAAFVPRTIEQHDCYLTMYHDQGCIPFKMLAFDEGVNTTMGLPIVRTSPDHGTAFNIAWQGVVAPDSFFAAAELAVRLVGSEQSN